MSQNHYTIRPAASTPRKRLAVFCDGTWVGRETKVAGAPDSNIRQLANMVGKVVYKDDTSKAAVVHPIIPHGQSAVNEANHRGMGGRSTESSDSIIAGYQEGVGLNHTFLDYIWDGATASDIGDECISVYKFIVENYTDEHDIWLFGFSRGAFTVRCVAGMINNCGIIKRRADYSDDDLQQLCYNVFRTYRSNLPADKPNSDECELFKGNPDRVWQVTQPIRFMGIIDTVGALGIPRLNAGVGFDWAPFEFFDQYMSSVVQHVYHAPALHDRLWIFQPCLVYPSTRTQQHGTTRVHQKWFPGTHYDVGRMTFRFIRQSPTNTLEKLLGFLPDLLSRTIYPNQVLSDCVLRYILESVAEVNPPSTPTPHLIPNITTHISTLDARIASPAPNTTGSGDIYGNVLSFAPAGTLLGPIRRLTHHITTSLNSLLPDLEIGTHIQSLLGINEILGILTAVTDRRIPGTKADVFEYKERVGLNVDGRQVSVCVADNADMRGRNEWGKERYVSRSFENFELWGRVFGERCGARKEIENGIENGYQHQRESKYDDQGR